ncbi:winged helix-turn-helix domain-containing protein, partial [Roseateles sp. P5_E1]
TSADVIRIGECTVTLSSREVTVPGARRPRRLTPKALGVLKALMRAPGAVVTRDELFAEVWPDTLPTNDVLTQAVTQLRKAFSNDDVTGTPYIETIAKTGYRLLVPVRAVDAAPAAEAVTFIERDDTAALDVPAEVAAPATGSLRSRWRRMRRYVLLALGVGMMIALLVLTALLLQRPAPSAASSGVLE